VSCDVESPFSQGAPTLKKKKINKMNKQIDFFKISSKIVEKKDIYFAQSIKICGCVWTVTTLQSIFAFKAAIWLSRLGISINISGLERYNSPSTSITYSLRSSFKTDSN
jgi:hypothetical protein